MFLAKKLYEPPLTSRVLDNFMLWKKRNMNSNVNSIKINKYTKMARQL